MQKHWNHFLALEADLDVCTRYVEFDPKNYGVFSVEFAKLLLACASEVDVVAKVLCRKIKPQGKFEHINHYRPTIVAKYTNFSDAVVEADRYSLDFTPWRAWGSATNPTWWRQYNDVKHERSAHFTQANLKNAILATAGLFVMLLYCYYEDTGSNNIAVDAETKLLTTPWYGLGQPAQDQALYSVPKES